MLHPQLIKNIDNKIQEQNNGYHKNTIENYYDLNMIEIHHNEKISIAFLGGETDYDIIIPDALPEPIEYLTFGMIVFRALAEGYLYYNNSRECYKLTTKGMDAVAYLIL